MSSVQLTTRVLAVAAGLSISMPAAVITNGGFEAGLSGWVVVDQTDPLDPPNTNTFFVHSGTASPVTSLPVPAPPQGDNAAMTDSAGPGSHVLYQDFVVPAIVTPMSLTFALFVNNLASDFFIPSPDDTLNFGTTARNQQGRVDLMMPSSDPFSLEPADILLNLFRTFPGSARASGYQNYTFDLTSVLQAHEGQTLRLRFAEVNNVDIFHLGVDAVSISEVPEPSTTVLMMTAALIGLMRAVRR